MVNAKTFGDDTYCPFMVILGMVCETGFTTLSHVFKSKGICPCETKLLEVVSWFRKVSPLSPLYKWDTTRYH